MSPNMKRHLREWAWSIAIGLLLAGAVWGAMHP